MKYSLFLACFVVLSLQYGEVKKGFPSHSERVFLSLVNAYRVSPYNFAKKFLHKLEPSLEEVLKDMDSLRPSSYSHKYNEIARDFAKIREHGGEKFTDESFAERADEETCDGSYKSGKTGSLPKYYPDNLDFSLYFMHHLLCGDKSDDIPDSCPNDKNAIKKLPFNQVDAQMHGVGIKDKRIIYAIGTSCSKDEKYMEKSHLAGSHLENFPQIDTIRFFAIYTSKKKGDAPSSVSLILNKSTYSMDLAYKTDNEEGFSAVYTYDAKMNSLSESYRTYTFKAQASSGEITYPTTGMLYTYGEAGCTIDYKNEDQVTPSKSGASSGVIAVLVILLIVMIVIAIVAFIRYKKNSNVNKKEKVEDDYDSNYVPPKPAVVSSK